ncbi:MAG: sel1 repeat family protein [Lentimicrobiaceae bacterium]|nr:sel1 repeat family protein [Lentimicrobiaceae bacterium]
MIAEKSSIEYVRSSNSESIELAQTYFEKAESIRYEEDSKPEDHFPLYLKAANMGHYKAQLRVVMAYLDGDGVERDDIKAFEWCKIATESEEVDAFVLDLLAWLYNDGIGTKKDKKKAFEIYNKAFALYLHDAENGDINAMGEVACYYKNGLGISKNPKKAFVWTERVAEKIQTGESLAKLAYYYETGYGTERNIDKSSELYAKVIDMCSAEKLFDIAEDFAYSDDKREKEQAHRWYSLAAEKGNAKIIKDVALYYDMEENVSKAMEYYEKAAVLGDIDAMTILGDFYYYGYDIEKNYAKAIKFYKKAFELGNADKLKESYEDVIFENIADMYSSGGYGIEQNISEAYKWEMRAKKSLTKIMIKRSNINTDETTKIIEPAQIKDEINGHLS